jgi:hypothetical protein
VSVSGISFERCYYDGLVTLLAEGTGEPFV